MTEADEIAESLIRMSAPDIIRELRRCIETFRPYTARPFGAPGSAARLEQEDRRIAYETAIQIVARLEGAAAGFDGVVGGPKWHKYIKRTDP